MALWKSWLWPRSTEDWAQETFLTSFRTGKHWALMSVFVFYYFFRHLDTANSITTSSSALATRKLKAQFEDHPHDCTHTLVY